MISYQSLLLSTIVLNDIPFAVYLSHKLLKMMGSKLCVWGNSQLKAIGTMQYNAFIVGSISAL